MNYKEIPVKNHQIMSFSKVFAHSSNSKEVFWPGCAMLSLGSDINIKTYNLLKTKMPELGYSTYCCGKPSLHINKGRDFSVRKQMLNDLFLKNNIKKVYTLCPNCFGTMSDHCNVEIESAWGLIDELFPKDKLNILTGRQYAVHDPCPIIDDIGACDYIRNILNKLGAEILEFKSNRDKTICCGKKNMIMALEPEKGKKIFAQRAAQAPSKNIVSYCASCVDTFKQNSFNAHHILELLWQTKSNGSWINRYKTVNSFKRG